MSSDVTVYIVGAGASHHAGYPLAYDLGNALNNWVCRAVPDRFCPERRLDEYKARLDSLVGHYGCLDDFEVIATDLDEWSHALPEQRTSCPFIAPGQVAADLRSAVADFFSQVSGGASLYRRLAENRTKDGDVIITFNYDVELERELKRAGLWEIGDGYGFRIFPREYPSGVKVLKPHGSINWVQGLGPAGAYSAGDPYEKRPVLMPQDLVALGYNGLVDSEFMGGGVDRPRIVLPGRNKHFETRLFEWLWNEGGQVLRDAAEVVVIGYSLPEADERARHLILDGPSRKARVTICCRDDNPRISELFHSSGFSDVSTADSFESWLAGESVSTGFQLSFVD